MIQNFLSMNGEVVEGIKKVAMVQDDRSWSGMQRAKDIPRS
jgi:hypothetical protein